MPALAAFLAALHLALALGWVVALVLPLAGRAKPALTDPLQPLAAAALAAFAAPYLFQAGWWPDLPGKWIVPAFAALGLLMLWRPTGLPGRIALTGFAGFYLALGALSLRNANPLAPFLAWKALLLGAALLLQAGAKPGRVRDPALLLLLLAAAATGLVHPPAG
jgi:hypothetical protein